MKYLSNGSYGGKIASEMGPRSIEVGCLCAGQRLCGDMLVLSGLPGSGFVGGDWERFTVFIELTEGV